MTKQIMIVDDDVETLELMQMILESAGYDVSGSTTGKEIQQGQSSDLPDLILLDVKQAEDEGRALCMHLKTHEQTKEVPILMLSKHVPAGQLKEAYLADDFLAKPFELDTLLDKVEQQLLEYS
jgi:CheY-like chemotaxis protein